MKNTQKTNILLGFSIATFALASSVFAFTPVDGTFSDIGGRDDRQGIEFLKKNGVIKGYDDGTYKPEQSITRAEFTKIVIETTNIPLKKCKPSEVQKISSIFSDVNAEDWFAKYICSANKSGLINGYDDGTFKPNNQINFVESAKIITLAQDEKFINLAKIEADLNENSDNPEWFAKYIVALENENAIDLNLMPEYENSFSRGQMADVIWRLSTGTEIVNTTEPLEINSCATLEKQLQKSQRRNNVGIDTRIKMDVKEVRTESITLDSAPMLKSMYTASAGDTSSDDFSTTNIQEFGVDEADIIKNDGSHIFFARGEDVRIVKAYPQNEMKEDAVITVPNMRITELFLDGNTLVLIGNKNEQSHHRDEEIMLQKMSSSYYNYSNFTEVRVFDISDRTNPKQTRSVSIEGNIISTRKIEDIVYLVTNNYLYNYTQDSQLPRFSDNGAISHIAKCDQISYFPNFTSQNLTTVSAINIKNIEEKVAFKNILGAGRNIYSSAKNLFIIQSDSAQEFVTEEKNGISVAYWDWKNISRISKFSLDGTNVEFVAQGEVKGNVLNQYSMSEYDNHFRIATHTNGNWRNGTNNSENIVSILNENLEKTGEITGIAKGESIKSVRFMGKRGFVVTFKTTDPLFVIDMSPENPQILGELKIPGWSDYLHPIDENYLIGFGKEVSEEAIDADRLTWDMQKGMKISIFDVSDLKNPKEIHKTVIGDRGTKSEILRNPKALFFDAERKLIGFPIRINKIKKEEDNGYCISEESICECKVLDNGDTICPSCQPICEPQAEIKNVFTGAQLYSFDINTGFILQGAVSHFPYYETEYWNNSYIIKRLVRIGENMYSISNDMIKGLDMKLKKDTSKEVLFVKAGTCSEIKDISSCMNRNDCEPIFVPFACDEGTICIQQAIFDSCAKI